MDPARIVALARRVARRYPVRWRDDAESVAALAIWEASLRWEDRGGNEEAWVLWAARGRIGRTMAATASTPVPAPLVDRAGGVDPAASVVARERLCELAATPAAATVARARVLGATWAEAGALIGRSSWTARGLLAA